MVEPPIDSLVDRHPRIVAETGAPNRNLGAAAGSLPPTHRQPCGIANPGPAVIPATSASLPPTPRHQAACPTPLRDAVRWI
ncbi:hypothetical protein HNQ78_002905 [Phycisphaera mikurensis]|nr:hypothetical protein [Phycisphaera mikurensis]